MPQNYLCSVGDSFMFGEELIPTYYAAQFPTLTKSQLYGLGYSTGGGVAGGQLSDYIKYIDLLNEVRFTSLIAKNLNLQHLNYSQGGASQEGIKMQAMLLMDNLRKNNIDPADTTWLIGLTMPSRMSFLKNPEVENYVNAINIGNTMQYIWSRFSSHTFFSDTFTNNNNQDFTTNFIKEMIAKVSETEIHVSWAMHLRDTINLMKANNVNRFYLLNLFTGYEPSFKFNVSNVLTKNLLLEWAGEISKHLVPNNQIGLDEVLKLSDCRCPEGHPNAEGHRRLATYLTQYLNGQIPVVEDVIASSK